MFIRKKRQRRTSIPPWVGPVSLFLEFLIEVYRSK
jgi:hypothetical protein